MKKRQSMDDRIQYHADRAQYAEEVGNASKAEYHRNRIAYITADNAAGQADEIAHAEEFIYAE